MFAIKNRALGSLLIWVCGVFGVNSAWALLPIELWTESSGAQVWLVQSPAIPMVDVQIAFDAGSRRDPADQAGLASAVAAMTAKGVQARGDLPALDENGLGEAWADLGASFDAEADRDGFGYALRSLTEPALLERAARLAARQIAAPSLPAPIWERERARWSAAIKESDTRPGTQASKAFATAVYGPHPYAQRATPQTLARLEVSDMRAFHARYIVPCRARVAIVGAVNRDQARALVAQLLGDLPPRQDAACAPLPAVAEVPPLAQAVQQHIPFASAQAQVLIGQPGIARSNPDFLALLVGNHILGGSGLVSRLTEEVREKRGLSYSVSSSFSPGLHAGAFVVALQTRADQSAQAVQVARETVARYVAEGPTEAELRAAKDNLIGGFALRIDSNRKLLANVMNIALNGLPLDYLDHWTDRVEALTAADIRAALQRHLQPERMVTVVVGGQP